MVTSQYESEDNNAAYAAGVNLIINKPFTEESLKEAIDNVIT